MNVDVQLTETIRQKLGMKKQTKISFSRKDNRLFIHPLNRSYFDSLAGILGTDGRLLRSLKKHKKSERAL